MFQRARAGVWTACLCLALNVVTAAADSTPYPGIPFAVPGLIEAETFDNGGEGIAYHDTTAGNSLGAFRQTDVDIEPAVEGGFNIGKIKAGEWLKYSVNVFTSGQYLLEARVASLGQGGTFHIEFAGQNLTGALTIPNTGTWQTWTTISTTISLSAGTQAMRVVFDTAGPNTTAVGNLNWVRLSAAPSTSVSTVASTLVVAGASTPFTGVPVTVPGTLKAENFDNGGEGVAYHDTTAGNAGGQYRATDVDIEASSLGGYNVTSIADGEWLAYSVNVATAGTYTLTFQVAAKPGKGGKFHASFGATNTSTISVSKTGGLQQWATVTATANLPAGVQVMKVVFDNGGFNLAGITLALSSAPPPPPPPPPPSGPAVPTSPSIADGATGVTVTPYLSWQAANSTSCELRLGTSNPPATVVASTTNYSYTPSLAPSSTYYWQVVAKNANGTAVGPVWSFTTAAPTIQTPIGPSAVPTSYNAITDRTPRPKPALPVLGPAGFSFTDPTFGSNMLRVTDANTRPTSPNVSYRTPAAAPARAWNSTSTYFYVVSTDGNIIPYAFNETAMTASRLPGAGDGGLILGLNFEPSFSQANPNLIYGTALGGNNRTIAKYDFSTGAYSTVLDLDTVVGNLAGTYMGPLATGGEPTEYMIVAFGGVAQDLHHYLAWFPVNNPSARKLIDTTASTLNGVATNIALNFRLHALVIDKSGRYVFLYPTAPDLAAPRYASQAYIWDTTTDIITAITSGGRDGSPNALSGGHATAGFGYGVNHDCCVSSTWDGAQWILRSLANPLKPWDLISPVLTPQEIYLSEHPSWNNAQPNVLVPILVSTYRYGNNTAPWRAWDDEVIAIETSSSSGATVWRFAHHRSNISSDTDPLGLSFWYTPRANIAPNGRWAIFTSNWEKTLGLDARDGQHRQDVFLVNLR